MTVLVIMYIVKNLSDTGSYGNYKDMVQMESDCLSFCQRSKTDQTVQVVPIAQPHTKNKHNTYRHTFCKS